MNFPPRLDQAAVSAIVAKRLNPHDWEDPTIGCPVVALGAPYIERGMRQNVEAVDTSLRAIIGWAEAELARLHRGQPVSYSDLGGLHRAVDRVVTADAKTTAMSDGVRATLAGVYNGCIPAPTDQGAAS